MVAILSGGNIDPMLLLRVIEHGLASAGRFLRLSVRCGDQPGELARLLAEIAEQRANVVDVVALRGRTRGCGFGEVEVALSVETRGPDHSDGADRAPCAAPVTTSRCCPDATRMSATAAAAVSASVRPPKGANFTTVTLMSAPLGAV